MYYFLHFGGEDEKKEMSFSGTIYNKKKLVVDTIFDDGNILKESDIHAPFTIILDEKESSIKKKSQTDKISTYVIESGFVFLISPTARAIFEKLNIDNLQYFDVVVKSSNLEVKDYKIVNITDKIDCVDFDASDLELYRNGNIDSITTLVLNENKIPKDKQIFLLGRRATGVIIVHESLKKAIEESKLTGFYFVRLDEADQLY